MNFLLTDDPGNDAHSLYYPSLEWACRGLLHEVINQTRACKDIREIIAHIDKAADAVTAAIRKQLSPG